MTTIEKIKAEIERLKKGYEDCGWDEFTKGAVIEDWSALLSFLDTLQEQEVKPDEELKNAAEEYCPDDAYPFGPDIINKEVRKAFIAGWKAKEKSEKPVPTDLEEAAVEYSKKVSDGHNYRDLRVGFIAGAKWQAEHQPLPEDSVLFNKGVEEGKRLMREEAVEGVVEDVGVNYIDLIDFDAEKLGLIEGDKVRIIVLKNTEK